MAAHGHTTTWGAQIRAGHTMQAQGWYAQFKTWWAARHDAKRTSLNAYWDARSETVRQFHADAAIDMVPQAHVHTAARAYCDLAL
jgi:hypothetical protein